VRKVKIDRLKTNPRQAFETSICSQPIIPSPPSDCPQHPPSPPSPAILHCPPYHPLISIILAKYRQNCPQLQIIVRFRHILYLALTPSLRIQLTPFSATSKCHRLNLRIGIVWQLYGTAFVVGPLKCVCDVASGVFFGVEDFEDAGVVSRGWKD
jgi:hypothetical protein